MWHQRGKEQLTLCQVSDHFEPGLRKAGVAHAFPVLPIVLMSSHKAEFLIATALP